MRVDFGDIPALWLALALLVVAGYFLLLWIIAHLGGWSRLAQFHRADGVPAGLALSWCSLQFAPGLGYNHCVRIVLAQDGIYLRPIFLARFAHPALLVPWQRIGTMQKARVLFWKEYYLPIYAAGRRFSLYVPVAARQWLDERATHKPLA